MPCERCGASAAHSIHNKDHVNFNHEFTDEEFDWKKSELAIEGRWRRAEEMINAGKEDIICCFGNHISCTCINSFPERDPQCPEHFPAAR